MKPDGSYAVSGSFEVTLTYTPPPPSEEVNENGEVIVEAVDETFGAMIDMARDYLADNPLSMAYDPDKTMS